jgi:hypothetical protein
MTVQEFNNYLEAKDRAKDINVALTKLGFSPDFVAAKVLSGDKAVTIAHVAMLWQGMPNKHDRKRTHQLFDLLSEVGLLEPKGDDETWVVTAAAT